MRGCLYPSHDRSIMFGPHHGPCKRPTGTCINAGPMRPAAASWPRCRQAVDAVHAVRTQRGSMCVLETSLVVCPACCARTRGSSTDRITLRERVCKRSFPAAAGSTYCFNHDNTVLVIATRSPMIMLHPTPTTAINHVPRGAPAPVPPCRRTVLRDTATQSIHVEGLVTSLHS